MVGGAMWASLQANAASDRTDERHGSVPAEVIAIDLPRLAALVGCSPEELKRGLGGASALHAHATFAHEGEKVAFETAATAAPPPLSVDTALISVASRPSALDSAQTPKVLMELAGSPVLLHALGQLAAAGISRAVLVLGARGREIRRAIAHHDISSRMRIDFLDLGEEYRAGFARSLLEARRMIPAGKAFLICTADHIFDKAIIRDVANARLAPMLDAVALVETVAGSLVGLPPTTVRVQLRDAAEAVEIGSDSVASSPSSSVAGNSAASFGGAGGDAHGNGACGDDCTESGGGDEESSSPNSASPPLIAQIGRGVGGSVHGIEAGLYLCTAAVFDALEAQSAQRSYFTLAQAMSMLASAGRLGAEFTRGRAWFAIETFDQLESTCALLQQRGGGSFPWQVKLARADSFSTAYGGRGPASDTRLVLAVSAASTAVRALPHLHADGERRRDCGFTLLPIPTPLPTPIGRHAQSRLAHADTADASAASTDVDFAAHDGADPSVIPNSPVTSRACFTASRQLSAQLPDLSEPLLPPAAASHAQPVAASVAPMRGGDDGAAFALSIEVPADVYDDDGGRAQTPTRQPTSRQTAYLIHSVPEGEHEGMGEYILALPEPSEPRRPPAASSWLCGLPPSLQSLPSLPSAVTSVRLEVQPSSHAAHRSDPTSPRSSPHPRAWDPASSDARTAYAKMPGSPPPFKHSPHQASPRVSALPSTRGSSCASPKAPSPLSSPHAYAHGGTQTAVRLTVEKSVPRFGWALLVYAVFASHSAGAVVNVEVAAVGTPERHVFLRYTWRGMCSAMLMFIVTLLRTDSRAGLAALRTLPRSQRVQLCAAALALFLNKALCGFTSVAHAALYDSMAPLWLVVGQLLLAVAKSRPVPALQNCVGVLVGGVGAALCMLDDAPVPTSASVSTDTTPTVLLPADELAFFTGLGSCLFWQTAEQLRPTMDPTLFLALVQIQFMALALAFACLFDDTPPELSRDPVRGIFGWSVLEIPGRLSSQLWLAAVVDYSGGVGFLLVMKYVPALVVAATMLFSPLFAWAEAMAIGQEYIPGDWTIIGALTVLVGSGLIARQAQTHSLTVDISTESSVVAATANI